MSILYRGHSIDDSYQVSVHLAKGFQRRRLECERLLDKLVTNYIVFFVQYICMRSLLLCELTISLLDTPSDADSYNRRYPIKCLVSTPCDCNVYISCKCYAMQTNCYEHRMCKIRGMRSLQLYSFNDKFINNISNRSKDSVGVTWRWMMF